MANFLVRCWLPRLDTYVSYQTAPNLARRTLEDIFGVRGICLETRKNAFRNLARGRWYVSLVLGKPQFNSRSWETPWDFPGKSRTCMFNSRSWETPWDLPGNSVCGVGFAFRIQERSACVSCFRCQDPILQVHGRYLEYFLSASQCSWPKRDDSICQLGYIDGWILCPSWSPHQYQCLAPRSPSRRPLASIRTVQTSRSHFAGSF